MKKSKDERAQEVCDRLHEMELSELAEQIIAQTDYISILDLFGDCKTADDVESMVNAIMEV